MIRFKTLIHKLGRTVESRPHADGQSSCAGVDVCLSALVQLVAWLYVGGQCQKQLVK